MSAPLSGPTAASASAHASSASAHTAGASTASTEGVSNSAPGISTTSTALSASAPPPPEDPTPLDLPYLLNHVFLPPKLPTAEEDPETLQEREEGLVRAMYNASKHFAKLVGGGREGQREWGRVVKMMKVGLKSVRALDRVAFGEDLGRMEEGDTIPFYARAQNAAILISHTGDHITYSAFEVTPPPEAITTCPGKLVCSFPGPAVQIPVETALEPAFIKQLVGMLVLLDSEKMDRGEETKEREGRREKEREREREREEAKDVRGYQDPRFLTQMVMFVLQGVGEEAVVRRVTKRVADEVVGDGSTALGSGRPWRRSPMMKVIKLAMELMLDKVETYKAFMVFFQTEVLRFMLKQEVGSELVHCARAKTARRVYKLEVRAGSEGPKGTGRVPQKIMKAFEAAMKRVQGTLVKRWEDEQRMHGDAPGYTHEPRMVEAAMEVQLRESREYLKKVLNPEVQMHLGSTEFRPSHVSRLREVDGGFTALGHGGRGMLAAIRDDAYVALADFEWLVQEKLDAWVEANKADAVRAARTLERCWEQYYSSAKERYAGNPEGESVMLLTLLELWVGIDIIACGSVDLLRGYSPEVPFGFLDGLLLRRGKQIERARKVGVYLRRRHTGIKWPVSIFQTELEDMSFSTQFFRRSDDMRALKRRIEREAQEERERKVVELDALNERYRELQERIERRAGCDYAEPAYEGGKRRHLGRTCRRCKLVKEQEALRVEVHEWPLPTRMYEAEAVCFELRCPPAFAIWRGRTYSLLRDVGMKHVPMQSRFSPELRLEAYEGLEDYIADPDADEPRSGRIMLGSESKTFKKGTYKTTRVPADEDAVCVSSGLRWRLFDGLRGESLVQGWEQVKMEGYCTLRIPEAPATSSSSAKGEDKDKGSAKDSTSQDQALYSHLQYAVTGTTHTHNETITNQGDCPRNLSLHEQLAFSNLRCGALLQWLNILRELRTNTLTFSREAVHTLVTQAAWQVGPLVFERDEGGTGEGTWKREWHRELEEVEFGLALVREAEELLKRVEANWMEGVTVKTIIYLTSRLLSSIPPNAHETHHHVLSAAYTLLRNARKVTHTWMREILAKLHSAPNDAEAAELQRRACDMACTCRATYDVDPGAHLDAVLGGKEDLAILLECAIVVHDNRPPRLNSLDLVAKHPEYVKLLRRDARLSVTLEERIKTLLLSPDTSGEATDGLNAALRAVWSEYRPNANVGWTFLPRPCARWVVTETQPAGGGGEDGQEQRAQKVHLNLLDGKLLVDGRPLGRLPMEVVGHPVYKRVFGQKILDVIPADMPGMDYASRNLVNGYQVFFALRDDPKRLIIRARLPSQAQPEAAEAQPTQAQPEPQATQNAQNVSARSARSSRPSQAYPTPAQTQATQTQATQTHAQPAQAAPTQPTPPPTPTPPKTYELIPHTVLLKDFPTFFASEHVHWMDLASGEVEFRSLERAWEEAGGAKGRGGWRLVFERAGAEGRARMVLMPPAPKKVDKGGGGEVGGEEAMDVDVDEDVKPRRSYLLDVKSKIFQGIADVLRPLESEQYLSIIYDAHADLISIDLPRFRLSFFINPRGELESKNMQGMVVDANQSAGTLIGLKRQLVLRHKDEAYKTLPRARCVIIPHGLNVRSVVDGGGGGVEEGEGIGHHVRVFIDTTEEHFQRTLKWYKYDIDTDLGCLVPSSGSLTARLFLIYLHALTSHALPDPLTKQTGTAHALKELQGAACFSFQRLAKEDVKLLNLIGGLSPKRVCLPKGSRVMQGVKWAPHLGVLAQHGAFDAAVARVVEYAGSLEVFAEKEKGKGKEGVDEEEVVGDEKGKEKEKKEGELGYKSPSDPFLAERALRRNSIYYESLGPESTQLDSDEFDRPYEGRSSPHSGDFELDGMEARKTAALINAWTKGMTRKLLSVNEILDLFNRWGRLSGPGTDVGLEYRLEWNFLDLPSRWMTLYNLCRQAREADPGDLSKKFEMVFLFGYLAYTKPEFRTFIPVFLAVATMPRLFPAPPQHAFYTLTDGFEPDKERIKNIVLGGVHDVANSPAADLPRREDESKKAWQNRQERRRVEVIQPRIKDAVDNLVAQGATGTANPNNPFWRADDSRWFSTTRIMARMGEYFASCARNSELHDWIIDVSRTLQENTVPSPLERAGVALPRFRYAQNLEVEVESTNVPFTMGDLLAVRTEAAPKFMEHEFGAGAPEEGEQLPGQFVDTNELKVLFGRFRRSRVSALTPLYCDRLEKSRLELHGQEVPTIPEELPPMESVTAYRDQCVAYLRQVFTSITTALAPTTPGERVLFDSGHWTPIHPRSLLYPLASTSGVELEPEWKDALIKYAEAFIEYQHSQRLVVFSLHGEVDNFYKELRSAVFNREDAEKHPDWLLIQIQGNFIIRAIQSAVAAEMISPSSGTNTVLQLNMGEGKSHVIVPIVASALADSEKLVRVVVLKPLASQMFHSLVDRISGLTNRRVFYLPFSRDVKMGLKEIKHIRSLFEECASVQGVLVTQPEHILSFRLMVIDRMLASGCPLDDVAQGLYDTQAWLKMVSRDILDESDELLHVRYQLIYTMNEQQPLDDGPSRWITTQKILDLVRRRIRLLQEEFPDEVELLDHHAQGETVVGAFTYARLLGMPAAQRLVSCLAEDVVSGGIDTFTITGLAAQPRLRNAVLRFIKDQNVNEHTYRMVEDEYKGSGLWKGLLLLRGLLGHGILVYVLMKQRWRVDYGLDLKRSLLAVPYRAKDMPSLRSEFGHPDVAVCLTCLSYYYGGLNPSQVKECFDLLFKLDNPPQEYEKWVKRGGIDIPAALRQLIGVNTKDLQTFMNNVVPIFRHNQATIDFFLSQVVFPKEAKEFPHKLGTSGWDLVEEPVADNFVTGFSGTNDNSDLLPTSITQSDPVNQLRTNAQVLEYLLRPENDRYFVAADMYGQPCTAMEFLEQIVQEPDEIRVLLDVGAQMLEMTNLELVRNWLSLRKDIGAGVFVDDDDRLSVLTQDGVVEPFYSSPFSQRLHQCVVYLDDAHTRGTDIKLPRDFRAVVTLGPKVTKDRLVQGCMRMRKLGHGQSVVFYATPEIDRRIRESESIRVSRSVRVVDVLSWVMAQTCKDIEHHIPHWVQQGVDYHNRRRGELDFASSEKTDITPLRKLWLQPARRTLDEMYGVSNKPSPYDEAVNTIPAMKERSTKIGIKGVRDAEMEEEQEREVSHEVEQELQLERPPKVEAAVHRLEGDVSRFVKKGILPTESHSFISLFTPVRTLDETFSPANPWSSRLLCTRDFARTTRLGRETKILSEYLRPVHWIVSYTPPDGGATILVVMSPHEVNTLLPSIRKSEFVRLHMYAPRTIQAMKPMDDLTFYCIPPLSDALFEPVVDIDVRCQLNIFAGQLYFEDYATYVRLCFILGISPDESKKYELVESDRFVREKGRVGDMGALCLFERSPVRLLRMLIGLRRKGMSFENTHLGKILHARIPSPEEFEVDD